MSIIIRSVVIVVVFVVLVCLLLPSLIVTVLCNISPRIGNNLLEKTLASFAKCLGADPSPNLRRLSTHVRVTCFPVTARRALF
jgi:hypothetical protein